MSKKDNVILERVKKSNTYKVAMERAPEEERESIEETVKNVSEKFTGLIDKLFYIAQDPALTAKLRQELIRMGKDPAARKEEVTEDGES